MRSEMLPHRGGEEKFEQGGDRDEQAQFLNEEGKDGDDQPKAQRDHDQGEREDEDVFAVACLGEVSRPSPFGTPSIVGRRTERLFLAKTKSLIPSLRLG